MTLILTESSGLFAQVDFDDGNCPTYHNQIKGIHNVLKAVRNQLPSKSFILYSVFIRAAVILGTSFRLADV